MAAPGRRTREPVLTTFAGCAIDRDWAAGSLRVARKIMREQNAHAEQVDQVVEKLGAEELSMPVRKWLDAVPRGTLRRVNALVQHQAPPPFAHDETDWTPALFSCVNQIVARLGPWGGAKIASTDDWIFAAAHLLLTDKEMTAVFGKGARTTITQKRARMVRRGWSFL